MTLLQETNIFLFACVEVCSKAALCPTEPLSLPYVNMIKMSLNILRNCLYTMDPTIENERGKVVDLTE